jgi:RNA polymerase sigma factor for flagellar operon FliA
LGRAPVDAEMAEALEMSPADYRELVDQTQIVQQESLDDMYSDQSMWFADLEERADEALEREGLQAAIAAGIKSLPEREALVLQLYFVEEMNLEEIGLTMGVGSARICQIKKAALDKLRATLSDWD